MPFRSNFFGDKYAQPGTTMGEIDDVMVEKYGDAPSVYGARIEPADEESDFKVGGTISWNALTDDDDTYVEDLGFDGFETIEDAKQWLIDEIGVSENDIEVEA